MSWWTRWPQRCDNLTWSCPGRGQSHFLLATAGNWIQLCFLPLASSPLLCFSFQMLMLATATWLEANSLFTTWEFMDHHTAFSRFGTSVRPRNVCMFFFFFSFLSSSSSLWIKCVCKKSKKNLLLRGCIIICFLAFVGTDGRLIIYCFSPPEQLPSEGSSSCFWEEKLIWNLSRWFNQTWTCVAA